jgi:outer membrane receptor protein involved in Fe transport
MLSIFNQAKLRIVIISSVTAFTLLPAAGPAQVLEEITVTAQRREQSIQEVPISLEAFSGADIAMQGLRSMEDLSNYSPSVEIDVRFMDQDISIRGMGTTGNNLGLEQAVPIFQDGVHFGRSSMIMGAFLDLERIEVLRGPQPVYFGQNATAGAFSLTTRKPGPEWQGDLTAEYGNFGRTSVEGGIGGPVTETLGIRVAGQWDRYTGYIRDIVTDDLFPKSDESAARVTLQWAPTENFEATLKAEYTERARNGDGNAVCATLGEVPLTERAVIFPGRTVFDDIITVAPLPTDCENGFKRIGLREAGDISFKPVPGITQEDTRAGIVDISTVRFLISDVPSSSDNSIVYNYRLGLAYTLGNGSSVESTTAYVDYARTGNYDNSSSPILTNLQQRGEIFDMFSQELRFLSPRGGMFEWEAGVYYQQEDLDVGNPFDRTYSTQVIRANLRQPVRVAYNWQDSEWISVYGAMTFNFLDDRASLDIGARYIDVSKESHAEGYARTWIYDVDPINVDTDGAGPDVAGDTFVPSTQFDLSTGAVVQTRNANSGIINCATGHRTCGSYGAGFWTHAWQLRDTPDAWNTVSPVDAGPILTGVRDDEAIYHRDYSDDSIDPQVTLRYRPNDDISLYAKWARAFKGGGADIATGTLPGSEEEFLIEAETAEGFEVGAKGTLMDGSASYNITLFNVTIDDLQIATNIPTELGSGSFSANAGKQRNRGLEFDARWAVTDQLTLGLAGAIMDGVMVSYQGAGCTDAEFTDAATGPCLTAAESAAMFNGDDSFEGTIDRSGYPAPRTPDWKFVFDLDYWHPVMDQYKVTFNTKTTYSDGFILNVEDFSQIIAYDKRIVANFTLGYGPQDDTWALNLWLRNAFNEGVVYFPEFDTDLNGVQDWDVSPRNYRTYGVQFQYNYN